MDQITSASTSASPTVAAATSTSTKLQVPSPVIRLYNNSVLYITRKRFLLDNVEMSAIFKQGKYKQI